MSVQVINESTGEPVWWMKILLATGFCLAIVSLLWAIGTFGFINTVASVVAVPAILVTFAIVWGV